jgi:hypothetical protein
MIPCVSIGIISLDKLSEMSQDQLKAMCGDCKVSVKCDMGLATDNAIKFTKAQPTFKPTDTNVNTQSTDKLNLKKLASESMDFKHFHENSHPQNRLHQPIARPTDSTIYHTKQATRKPKNLQELAKNCMTFSNFHDQSHEE